MVRATTQWLTVKLRMPAAGVKKTNTGFVGSIEEIPGGWVSFDE
jgi:hypothetical protein